MLFFAHHDDVPAFGSGLMGHLVDALDEGAGGVPDGGAPRLKLCQFGKAYAVGPDDHLSTRLHILRPVHRAHALFAQRLNHLRVVDDRPQRHHRTERRFALRQLHRAADTEAETRVLGHRYAH